MQDTTQNTPSDDIPEITKENFWQQFDRAVEEDDCKRLAELLIWQRSHRTPER